MLDATGGASFSPPFSSRQKVALLAGCKERWFATQFVTLTLTLISPYLTLSQPNVAKGKFRPKFQISFSKILRNKWHHVKVQAENFLLNGHIIGLSKVGVTSQNSIKHSGSERVNGIRILESGKLLLVESGMVGFGIRNTAH